jgi:hypothetical protein
MKRPPGPRAMVVFAGATAVACALCLSQAFGARSFGDAKPPRAVLEQIDRLAPQRAGVIDVYAIVVAGDAQEDVFEREANVVRARLERRLNASGRIVSLINNRRLPQPEATLRSLQYTIEQVSKVMDKDEDLLFIHITSHGSANHALVLQHPSVDLHWLGAKYLANLLGRSGIRHRFVVISACYSGGFLKELVNADTVVLTAAAGTTKARGCGNASQITDFSRAFYVQAWTDSRPLMEAARMTAQYVHEEESRSRWEHSYPQLSVGVNMDDYIKRLESTLPAGVTGTSALRPR